MSASGSSSSRSTVQPTIAMPVRRWVPEAIPSVAVPVFRGTGHAGPMRPRAKSTTLAADEHDPERPLAGLTVARRLDVTAVSRRRRGGHPETVRPGLRARELGGALALEVQVAGVGRGTGREPAG